MSEVLKNQGQSGSTSRALPPQISKNLFILDFNSSLMGIKQDQLKLEKTRVYPFLKEMYDDPYFPDFLVDKGKAILIELCAQIENQAPKNLAELYVLTHRATDQFNDLQEEFYENDSEIETVARECIGADINFIATSYGFEADIEELIATRDW